MNVSLDEVRVFLTDMLGAEGVRKHARLVERSLSIMSSLVLKDTAKGRKKRRILKVATDLFVRQGYRRTSMDQIAAEAGVGKGTLYLYFKNKPEIMMHAIGLEKMKFMREGLELFKAAHPRRRLEEYLKLIFRMVTEMPLLSALLSGDKEMLMILDELGAEWGTDFMEIQVEFLGRMIKAATPAADPAQVERQAKILVGMIYSSSSIAEERYRSGLTVEQYAETLASMLVNGLAGVKPNNRSPEVTR